ncbi:hypothetical protein A4X09_0g770 [Tilletia walkeri]|uniref:Peptidase S54 rhomboid domain-containing protein n=1 Tax=Tilletia walkeri TaxID=117179 RepID=A0A8X7NE65_9BASI|nr:hypothetical protein A4X09_0g770 [Tilletia walkeri]
MTPLLALTRGAHVSRLRRIAPTVITSASPAAHPVGILRCTSVVGSLAPAHRAPLSFWSRRNQGQAVAATVTPTPDPTLAVHIKDADAYGLPKRGPRLLGPLLMTVFGCVLATSIAAKHAEEETEDLIEQYGLPSVRNRPQPTGSSSSSSSSTFGDFSSFFSSSSTSSASTSHAPTSSYSRARLQAQLESAHSHHIAKKLGDFLRTVLDTVSFLPHEAQMQVGRVYTYLAHSYLDLTPSQRAVLPILAINTLVFLGFRMPSARAQQFMWTHFTHQPNSRRYYTMVTSTFAHAGVIHFALNNYVLWQFSHHFISDPVFREGQGQFDFGFTLDQRTPHRFGSSGNLRRTETGTYVDNTHDFEWAWEQLASKLGISSKDSKSGTATWTPEASPTPHFIAFWISAGLFASFGSQIWAFSRFQAARLALRRRIKAFQRSSAVPVQLNAELVSRIDALRRIGSVPGLGASGAMLATIGAIAACHPEEMIGLLFLPQTFVPSQTAVSGLMLFDATCLFLTLFNSPLGAAARSLSLGHSAHLAGTGYGIWYASSSLHDVKKDTAGTTSMAGSKGDVPTLATRMSNGMALWETLRKQHSITLERERGQSGTKPGAHSPPTTRVI